MLEQELKELIELKEFLTKQVKPLRDTVTSKEEFDKFDGLTKDLMVAQTNATYTLISVLTLRIGLGLGKVIPAESEDKQNATLSTDNEKEAAPENPEPEQSVS